MKKNHFLKLYADAHQRSLTKENIISAFKATGVVPFNPDVVTEEKMAPSLETSTQHCLPVEMESPVQAVSSLIRDYGDHRRARDSESVSSPMPSTSSQSGTDPLTPVRTAFSTLASSSISFVVSPAPMTSAISPPLYSTHPISASKHRYSQLLNMEPLTDVEKLLQDALRESAELAESQKSQIRGMQATTVIQNVYVGLTHSQIQEHEERKKRPKRKGKFGDGMAKLVTGDEFTEGVKEHNKEVERQEDAKTAREEVARLYKEAMKQWTAQEKTALGTEQEKASQVQEAGGRMGEGARRGKGREEKTRMDKAKTG